MYSEFTVKLISEVKKREILYNNKYDRRPRAEKERCWEEIGEILNTDPEKCKKHWKNVRDRFVKIKHARDKHFMNNGSELTAPGYIYYDMLTFMTEFSIKKVITNRESQPIDIDEIIPQPLLLSEDDKVIDMTKEFLHEIKKYPIFYDPSAEFRRFKGKNEWKEISDALYSKFPISRLRNYWATLMKQYRLFEENRSQFTEPIKNENIFDLMSFVTIPSFTEDKDNEPIEYISFEESCKMEREHNPIVNVMAEDDYDDTYDNQDTMMEQSNQNYDDEQSEDEEDGNYEGTHGIFEPESKRPRFMMKIPQSKDIKPRMVKTEEVLDEYDYFGKKVAMQLRNLARKNLKQSRKAEIEVLQLLMSHEETAEGNENV